MNVGDKRPREAEQEGVVEVVEEEPAAGPPPPPPGGDAEDDQAPGPMPPQPKKKKVLLHEQVYLDALPSAGMYEKSYMHRDIVTHAAITSTQFFITGSVDGHVKFWKKSREGVEFVKHFRSHVGAIVDLRASFDGAHLCTIGADKSAKVYDVLNFDMMSMLKLDFTPSCCEWIYRRGEAELKLAIGDQASPLIHVFDARSSTASGTVNLHAAPVRLMRFNPVHGSVISADSKGMLEYWRCDTFEMPGDISFTYKVETDLYAIAKAKAVPGSLEIAPDGSQFVVYSSDRRVRVFRFRTGKLRCTIDESLDAAGEVQRSGAEAYQLENIDFGRRMAIEREIERDPAAPSPNCVFDQSGNFIIYPTYLGIKVVNLVSGRCSRLLGKVENTERFLRVALFQGIPAKDKRMKGSGEDMRNKELEQDPTLACVAFKKHRVFFFSRREPVDSDDAAAGRDVFNERPQAEDLLNMQAVAASEATALPKMAVLHTNMGDVHLKLYADECPKTVENFTTHAKNGYYDNLLFHRVIKGFMIQGGDPLGDGTGGTSIWGREFEDELRRDLRHDRPFTLSMANAGPNTNGSQFFITTVATPWLDNKHTVFGRVTKGADVVQAMEKVKVDKNDRPVADIKIMNITTSLA